MSNSLIKKIQVKQGEYDQFRLKQLIDNSSTASKMANLQDLILDTLIQTDITT